MHEKSDTPPSELAAKIHPVSTGNDGRNKNQLFLLLQFFLKLFHEVKGIDGIESE